jgi:cytochrome c-type biogenesis protein CcmH
LLNDLDVEPASRPLPPTAATGRAALLLALASATAAGLLLYAHLGRLDLLDAPAVTAEAPSPETLRASIEGLAEKLSKDPSDLEGWVLLGRSLQAIRNPQKAITAYEFALKLAPDDPDVGALLAQALAEANDGSLQGRPAELVRDILRKNPAHQTSLWLAGLAAAERRDSAEAVAHWEKLRAQLPRDGDDYKKVSEYIEQAAAIEPAVATPPKPPVATSSVSAKLVVRVSLATALAGSASPEASVFVFARAAHGPPMPLAVVRRQVKDLPFEVTLDDSMAMMENRKISSFDRVVIGARVSKSGQPTPSSGDLQGLTEPVPSSSKVPQAIEIRDVVP